MIFAKWECITFADNITILPIFDGISSGTVLFLGYDLLMILLIC